MCAMLLSFMILGNILVHTAFETTINRETNQGMEEMKIFQYAMLASLEGLPDDYQAIDMAVAEIAQSIRQSLYGDQGGIVGIIYLRSTAAWIMCIRTGNGYMTGILFCFLSLL